MLAGIAHHVPGCPAFVPGIRLCGHGRSLMADRRMLPALRYFWRITRRRSEEHTSELQSLMRISYAVFCLKKKKKTQEIDITTTKTQTITIIKNRHTKDTPTN